MRGQSAAAATLHTAAREVIRAVSVCVCYCSKDIIAAVGTQFAGTDPCTKEGGDEQIIFPLEEA